MVLNLQEMGLVVMGHKLDIPSQGTRWPRPGKGGVVGCGPVGRPSLPQLGSTLADPHTNVHCYPRWVSCLRPTPKAQGKSCEIARSFPDEDKGSQGTRANQFTSICFFTPNMHAAGTL